MREFLILFLIFNVQKIWATDFRSVDGKIEFAVAKVDGQIVWTEAEKIKLKNDKTKVAVGTVTAYSPTVVNNTPQKFEINLSTIIPERMSHGKFLELQTKDGLFGKISAIKVDLDLAVDLGDIQRAELLRQKYNWLKTYYGSLTK